MTFLTRLRDSIEVGKKYQTNANEAEKDGKLETVKECEETSQTCQKDRNSEESGVLLKSFLECPVIILIDKTFDYKSTHEDREEEQTCRYQDGEDRKEIQ